MTGRASRSGRIRGSAVVLASVAMLLAVAQASVGGAAGQTASRPLAGAGSYTDVGAVDLAAMLKVKNLTLINVHVPYAGEIEGTDLFIPFDQVIERAAELPADKSARVVVYCRSGRMSAVAARALIDLGYRDVWNLDRGMKAWQRAGYPLAQKGG